jgi:hypothetical protein
MRVKIKGAIPSQKCKSLTSKGEMLPNRANGATDSIDHYLEVKHYLSKGTKLGYVNPPLPRKLGF